MQLYFVAMDRVARDRPPALYLQVYSLALYRHIEAVGNTVR